MLGCGKLCSSNAAAVRGQQHPAHLHGKYWSLPCPGAVVWLSHTHQSSIHEAEPSPVPQPEPRGFAELCCAPATWPAAFQQTSSTLAPAQTLHALRAGAGPVAKLCILCPARSSLQGIADLASALNNAAARSARGWQPAGAAPRRVSASTPGHGSLPALWGPAALMLPLPLSKGRRKVFWHLLGPECKPQPLTSLAEGRLGLSVPAVWLAGVTETHRADPCAKAGHSPHGPTCEVCAPKGSCALLLVAGGTIPARVRPQAAALAMGVSASPDLGGLWPPSLHHPVSHGRVFGSFCTCSCNLPAGKQKRSSVFFPCLS